MRGESLVTSRRSENGASDNGTALVRLHLSGRFRAFRGDEAIPSELWERRRAARTLIKILAMAPDHRMHRERILEFLWPDAKGAHGLNRLGKALHAARRVLEPWLPARVASSYLALDGEMLSLHPANVWVDADDFEALARAALAAGTPLALESALEAYSGELLPEDCYADWARARRQSIKTLHLNTLIKLAEVREHSGQYRQAIVRLQEVLSLDDEAPEETHRFLMRLYALNGEGDRALRHFRHLSELLRDDLETTPNGETVALFTAIQKGTFPPPRIPVVRGPFPVPAAIDSFPRSTAAKHEPVLEDLSRRLEASISGIGGTALLEGYPGSGKSTVLRELGRLGTEQGVRVLWGTSRAANSAPYSLFVSAITEALSALPLVERQAYARRYRYLAPLVFSLTVPMSQPGESVPSTGTRLLQSEIMRCLSDLAGGDPLLLLLDDLRDADTSSLQTLAYLASRVADRPWLIVGTYHRGQPSNQAFEDLRTLIRRLPAGCIMGLRSISVPV